MNRETPTVTLVPPFLRTLASTFVLPTASASGTATQDTATNRFARPSGHVYLPPHYSHAERVRTAHIVGAAVGAGVLLLALLAVGFWLYIRRRSKATRNERGDPELRAERKAGLIEPGAVLSTGEVKVAETGTA